MVSVAKIKNDCKPCKRKQQVSEPKKHIGLLTGILLALLPKCPFCVMAYSSTLMLCGKGGTITSEHNFTSPTTVTVTALLCLLALLCIILNYRDYRTKYAIALAATGSAFIILSVIIRGGLPLYYSGVLLIFSGVWLNASLLYFVKRIKEYFKKPVFQF